jgi:hypothetical protein
MMYATMRHTTLITNWHMTRIKLLWVYLRQAESLRLLIHTSILLHHFTLIAIIHYGLDHGLADLVRSTIHILLGLPTIGWIVMPCVRQPLNGQLLLPNFSFTILATNFLQSCLGMLRIVKLHLPLDLTNIIIFLPLCATTHQILSFVVVILKLFLGLPLSLLLLLVFIIWKLVLFLVCLLVVNLASYFLLHFYYILFNQI